MCLSILVCIHDMKSWEVFKSKKVMDVCKYKPNKNFQKRMNFYLKTKRKVTNILIEKLVFKSRKKIHFYHNLAESMW